MSDKIINEIKELRQKKEKVVTALTKYTTQRDSIVETKNKLVAELLETFDIAPNDVEEKLKTLREARDTMMADAKAQLDKIKL